MATNTERPENQVGYLLLYYDNNTWMWPDEGTGPARCPACSYILDLDATNPNYAARRRFKPIYDPESAVSSTTAIASTYDGYDIVSEPFKKFCETNEYPGLEFDGFIKGPSRFRLRIRSELPFDSERRGTRFEKFCTACQRYASIAGCTPVLLKIAYPIPDGIFCADVKFATGQGRSTVILIGEETRQKLKKARFKGIDYEPAFGL